jgi:hypothetical protein
MSCIESATSRSIGLGSPSPENGIADKDGGAFLQEIVRGSVLLCPSPKAAIVKIGEQDHPGSRKRTSDDLRGFDSVHDRHFYIHEDDIGYQLPRELHARHPIGSLTDDIEVPCLQESPEQSAILGVIVYQENADRARGSSGLRHGPSSALGSGSLALLDRRGTSLPTGLPQPLVMPLLFAAAVWAGVLDRPDDR